MRDGVHVSVCLCVCTCVCVGCSGVWWNIQDCPLLYLAATNDKIFTTICCSCHNIFVLIVNSFNGTNYDYCQCVVPMSLGIVCHNIINSVRVVHLSTSCSVMCAALRYK